MQKVPQFLATSEMRKTGVFAHFSVDRSGAWEGGGGRGGGGGGGGGPSEWSKRAFGKEARSLWGTCLLVASQGVEHPVKKVNAPKLPIFTIFRG